MNIFVGNLPFSVTEEDVQQLFAQYGDVTRVNIITDRFSGKSRGFCFVEMPSKDDGAAAIEALNGQDFQGRSLTVNEARPRGPRVGGREGNRGGGRGDWGPDR